MASFTAIAGPILLFLLALILELAPAVSAKPLPPLPTLTSPPSTPPGSPPLLSSYRLLPQLKTFSVDQSCRDQEPQFDAIVLEAFHYALRASERTKRALENGDDEDWAKIFRTIMKTDITNTDLLESTKDYQDRWQDPDKRTAAGHVHRVLGGIGDGWVQVRSGADVRIYCDNMARYEPYYTSLGKKKFRIDRANLLLRSSKDKVCGPPGSGTGPNAVTVRGKLWAPPRGTRRDPNPNRCVIDICHKVFEQRKNRRGYFDFDYEEGKPYLDFETMRKGAGDRMIRTITTTLIHEWAHTSRYLQDDFRAPGKKGTSGWQIVNAIKTPEEAVQSAELMAYLGHFAWLADHRPKKAAADELEDTGGYVINRDDTQLN